MHNFRTDDLEKNKTKTDTWLGSYSTLSEHNTFLLLDTEIYGNSCCSFGTEIMRELTFFMSLRSMMLWRAMW